MLITNTLSGKLLCTGCTVSSTPHPPFAPEPAPRPALFKKKKPVQVQKQEEGKDEQKEYDKECSGHKNFPDRPGAVTENRI